MKTYSVKPKDIQRKWYVVDATDQPLGRLACRVAQVLRGKHKPIFSYHADVGDFVIVINARNIKLTGSKSEALIYWHTLHPAGLRSITRGKLRERNPERLLRRAVWGMLPKHRLGRKMIKKLKIYAGPEHPHEAQKPEPLPDFRGKDGFEKR